ncbi:MULTISPECIES: recombinase family protein [unclassified Synechococcus]|uniref:recombinase family protein n=1 Tax=unclassified Synechococcus TaxID=2626047 RepID=UPI001E324F58|nr:MULTISPECIES: recombinase family protein [unclassified Synechococcus]
MAGCIFSSPDRTLSPVRWLAYYRVSTDRQEQSGLGLEAQRAKAEALATERYAVIAAEFVEVESGRQSDRPKLAASLAR